MKQKHLALNLSLATLLSGYLQISSAAPPELFFGPQLHEIPAHVNLPEQAQSGIYVKINHDLLRETGLSLQLPNGKTVTAGRQRSNNFPNGSQVWSGGVVGEADSSVILAQHGSALAGVIRTEDGLFKIQPTANGVHMVVEVSPNEPFPEIDPPVGDSFDLSGSGTATADVTGSDDGSLIDVMIVYSTDTKNRYGGVDGVNALIATAIAETNQAYFNSGIQTQLRLVHTSEVQNASGDMSADLSAITNMDGVMDHVHDLRNQYGADLVSWFQESAQYCGIAWVNKGDLSYDAGGGFSVVASSCATGYFSTGHEMGHNMGSMHDIANSSQQGVYSYSYGFQDPDNTFRTVMSYNCAGGCTRVQHFSNPNITYAGKPTGEANAADNARSINLTRIPVSQWRSVTVNTPPSAGFDFSCIDLSCDFTDTSSASNIVSRTWAFGDGDTSSVINPQHTFAAAGVYTVVLTITDDTGSTGQHTQMVEVSEAVTPPPSGNTNPPSAPTGFTVTDDTVGGANLSWTDTSDNELMFELERESQHPKNGKWVGNTIVSAAEDSQNLTDQVGSGIFHYRIRATNGYGSSSWSNWVTVTITDSSSGGGSGGGGSKGGGGKGKPK